MFSTTLQIFTGVCSAILFPFCCMTGPERCLKVSLSVSEENKTVWLTSKVLILSNSHRILVPNENVAC